MGFFKKAGRQNLYHQVKSRFSYEKSARFVKKAGFAKAGVRRFMIIQCIVLAVELTHTSVMTSSRDDRFVRGDPEIDSDQGRDRD